MHDRIGSVVNLAKARLLALDRAAIDTTLPTATLELLLNTLIDLGTPAAAQKTGDDAARSVMGVAVAIGEARRAETDDQATRAAVRY